MNKQMIWNIVTVIELVIATCVILLDFFIPTIVILGLIVISLLIRWQPVSVLGFKQNKNLLGMAFFVLLAVVLWNLFEMGLIFPVLNRVTGTTQDLSAFVDLKGNLPKLLFPLAASWTLAALGEEMVYRGFLQRRVCDLFGDNRLGIGLAVAFSSILFGFAHTEQGVIGVVITTLDALYFSWLKYKFENNLWASILAHGFSNTIGVVVFYFIGPIYGFW